MRHHILIIVLVLILGACQKDAQSSKTDLLAKNWQSDEVQTTILGFRGAIYKKGATSNLTDFSKLRFYFRKDGTADLIDMNGNKVTGLWKFTNNETQIEVLAKPENRILNIINLSANNFDFDTKVNDNGQTIDATFKMILE